jgi:hypothetical protein
MPERPPARRVEISRRSFAARSLLSAVTIPSGWVSAMPDPTTASLITSIDGPLVVTGSFERQRLLFERGFGLLPVADQNLDAATTEALFGVERRSSRTLLLETPGTRASVRLVAFEPSSTDTVRGSAQAIDADAWKVIDFMVPDFDRAVAHLQGLGFGLGAPPAEYSVPPDGRFREGHLEGPDGVTCAILRMYDTPMSRYVRVTDRLFSEVLGVSSPVSDRESAIGFYRGLGLPSPLSYEIATESFQKLLGAKEPTLLRGMNFAARPRRGATPASGDVDPTGLMIGVIHYGLPSTAFRSLRSRARLPRRGLQAIRLTTSSIDKAREACVAGGGKVIAETRDAILFPHGHVRSLLVEAPHGPLHHFVEPIAAS